MFKRQLARLQLLLLAHQPLLATVDIDQKLFPNHCYTYVLTVSSHNYNALQ